MNRRTASVTDARNLLILAEVQRRRYNRKEPIMAIRTHDDSFTPVCTGPNDHPGDPCTAWPPNRRCSQQARDLNIAIQQVKANVEEGS